MESALAAVIPSLVAEGVFGAGEFGGLSLDRDADKGAQFGSSIAFVTLVLSRPSGPEEIPLVIKVQSANPWFQDNFDMKRMFQRELFMYKNILPVIGAEQSSYPKLYHGFVDKEGFADDIIVLKNMKEYRKCESIIAIDFAHMSLAIEKLACFHSLSYTYKQQKKSEFTELAEKLTWVEKNEAGLYDGRLASLKRSCAAHAKKFGANGVIDEFLRIFGSGLHLRTLAGAEEPHFGVICHGDYCNNNVIYKYDVAGAPTDCAILDFQLSIYGSPAIDLAFFLYMHTAEETRERHWDELLRMYWETLTKKVPPTVELPTYEQFLDHFASRAAYGCVLCANFIPFLMDRGDFEKYGDMSREEQLEIEGVRGGSEAESIVRPALDHAFRRKYIHGFVNFIKNRSLETEK